MYSWPTTIIYTRILKLVATCILALNGSYGERDCTPIFRSIHKMNTNNSYYFISRLLYVFTTFYPYGGLKGTESKTLLF